MGLDEELLDDEVEQGRRPEGEHRRHDGRRDAPEDEGASDGTDRRDQPEGDGDGDGAHLGGARFGHLGDDGQAEEEDLQGQGDREDDPLGGSKPGAHADEDTVEEQVDRHRREHAHGQGDGRLGGDRRADAAGTRLGVRRLLGQLGLLGLRLRMPSVGAQPQHHEGAGHEADDGPGQVPGLV